MSIELPPLYGTTHGYACEAVEARERTLTARIAELESAVVGLLDFEPGHCPCGDYGCSLHRRPWDAAHAAMTKETKP